MKTIQNIKNISLGFFILTGIIHISTSVLIANKLFLKNALIINKVFDIPFILTGIIYGFSSLRLNLTDPHKDNKILDISLLTITIVILAGLLTINLALPDLKK